MIAPAITKPLAMPVQRDYVSWSAISTYQQCPLRYFFRYIEGLEETFTSASLALGGAVHSAVEFHFNELMVGNPAPDHDTLLNAFWDGWRCRAETTAIQLGKSEDLDSIGKTADRVITAFRASEFARPQGRIIGVEEELRSPLIPGLSALPESRVHLVVDSQYVSRGVTEWLPSWIARDGRSSGRRSHRVANVDLWQRLAEQLSRHEFVCQWVRGHSGHPENEFVDQMARRLAEQAARQQQGGPMLN